MPESIITYETLYDALRKERTYTELQKLEPEFYKKVVSYLQDKESIIEAHMKKQTSYLGMGKNQLQLENVKKLIRELYEKREQKIIQLAVLASRTASSNIDTANMIEEEKKFYETTLEILDSYRANILIKMLNKELPAIPELPKGLKRHASQQDNTKLVRFVHAVPKFVGEDMQVYGPFEAEDVANLPEKVANLLIEKNRATSFNV